MNHAPRAFLRLLLCALLCASPAVLCPTGSSALAQVIVYDPTNHATAIKEFLETAALLKNALEQAEKIADSTNWGEAEGLLASISELADQAHELIEQGRALSELAGSDELAAAITELREVTAQALSAVVSAHLRQTDDLAESSAKLAALQAANDAAVGRMAALQTGNQIASHQAAELTKLRALLRDLLATQSMRSAQEQSEKAAREKALAEFLDTSEPLEAPAEAYGTDDLPGARR